MKRIINLKFGFINFKRIQSILGNAAKLGILLVPVLFFVIGLSSLTRALKYKETVTVPVDKNFFTSDAGDGYFQNFNFLPSFIMDAEQKKGKNLETPLRLVWRPQESFGTKRVAVGAQIQGDSNWNISMVYPNYHYSQSLDNKVFFDKRILPYSLIADFNGVFLYGRDKETVTSKNTKDFIEKELAKGTTLRIVDDCYQKESLISQNIEVNTKISTEISPFLRGTQDYFVYLKESLLTTLTKQDLNWSKGADPVSVNLYDLYGNGLGGGIIEDDGVDEENPDAPEKANALTVEIKVSKPGIYRLNIANPDKGGSNDWVITNLRINTNKIVTTGEIQLRKGTKIYTKISDDKKVGFRIWRTDSLQTVVAKAEKDQQELPLTAKDFNEYRFLNLTKNNSYGIEVAGNIYIKGSNFAFSPENYFEPFIFDLTNEEDPAYILAPLLITKTADNHYEVKKYFEEKDFWKLKNYPIARGNAFSKSEYLKEITFFLNNPEKYEERRVGRELTLQGYKTLGTFKDITLWSSQAEKIYAGINPSTLSEWLQLTLPNGAIVKLDPKSKYENQELLNNQQPADFKTDETTFNMSLRGGHSFYLFAKDDLNLKISKTDVNNYSGKDDAVAKIIDDAGEVICQTTLTDDGNFSDDLKSDEPQIFELNCPNIATGTYILDIAGIPEEENLVDNDFLISRIQQNSNKLVVREFIINTEPFSVYTNNKETKKITTYFWRSGKDQVIEYKNAGVTQAVTLDKDSPFKYFEFAIPTGLTKITEPKGYAILRNANFSFTSESWFEPIGISIRKYVESPHYLIDNIDTKILTTKIYVE